MLSYLQIVLKTQTFQPQADYLHAVKYLVGSNHAMCTTYYTSNICAAVVEEGSQVISTFWPLSKMTTSFLRRAGCNTQNFV